jgi:type II secretory pathway pseudopilin PulG
MNTSLFQSGKVRAPHGQRGFTMIEIAIAIGVIAFGLIAVIGILPQGMNSQKDNREDTIISQDAPYFLNAIRNGEMRTNANILTNYVETIFITNVVNTNNSVTTNIFSYTNTALVSGGGATQLPNDLIILGLLSTPAYDNRPAGMMGQTPTTGPGITNYVMAIVRAMSGSAEQQNGANAQVAFRYQINVENAPWNFFTGYNPLINPAFQTTPPGGNVPVIYTNSMTSMLHDLRLKFSWPVLPNGNLGDGRQTYRTMVSSHLLITNNYFNTPVPLFFFQPLTYNANVAAN